MNAKTIYHIYLGVRSADAEGRFGTAPLFLGARECRAVERAQDFGLELISALSASDAVVLTGAFEPGEVWPPIPIIGAAYRLYCGVDLLDSGVAHLSEGGVICAGKIDFRGKPLYLVPDNPSIEALSYALISRELNLPSRGAYAPAPVQIFPEAASAVQYTPEPMGTPVVCGPQYPYAEREKLEPWDDEIFSQMWGHPIFPEETGAEPFEPYMPEEFQENYLERVSERMQNAPRLRAEPPRESAAHIEAEDSMAAAFIE
ncbi:MAG: hypothetical protein LBC78_01590, partial [Oscillospiraceae bacterium]|nr:hypothetical protein [Oscillospiraceae bacterium]